MKLLIAFLIVLSYGALPLYSQTEDAPKEETASETQPAEDKPAEDKPAEDKSAEDKSAEDKPAEDKPAEDKPAEDKPAEDKPAEDKPAEDKPAEDKPAEDKPAEDKPAEDKPAEEENTLLGLLPDRPETAPFYLNTTANKQFDLSVVGSLNAAREATRSGVVAVLIDELPQDVAGEDYAAGILDKWAVADDFEGRAVAILVLPSQQAIFLQVTEPLRELATPSFCASFSTAGEPYLTPEQTGDVVNGLITAVTGVLQKQEGLTPETTFGHLKLPPAPVPTLAEAAGPILANPYLADSKESLERKLRKFEEPTREMLDEFSAQPSIDWAFQKYLDALEQGLRYPFVDLFTPGSQLMRLNDPKSRVFMKVKHREYMRSVPYRVFQQGDLAAIRFEAQLIVPVFLRRDNEGLWRIDTVYPWVTSQTSYSRRVTYPLYTDHPWMFAYPDYGHEKSRVKIPALVDFSTNLIATITEKTAAVQTGEADAATYFELADLLYWEANWVKPALALVEKGLELDKQNPSYHWLAIHMRTRIPDLDGLEPHYQALMELTPDDREVWTNYMWFAKNVAKDSKKLASLERDFRKKFK